MAKIMDFKVLIKQDEDGVFVASVPSLPGCHTQGKTYEEAIKNAKEAIELCLVEIQKNPQYRKKVNEISNQKDSFVGIANVPVKEI